MKKTNHLRNFLQTEQWAVVNEKIGHKVIRETIADSLVIMIIKNAKRGRYMEIPCGPLIDWNDETERSRALNQIKSIATAEKCVFIRMRPQLEDSSENRQILQKSGLKVAPMHLAAEHTVIIDLTKSEDDLLAGMRRQTRYEVRQSIKKEIVVEKSTNEQIFKEFFQIQAETAARQHFIPPSQRELLAEHEAFGDHAVMYIAKTKDGAPIAYGLIIKSGEEADYYEAASTDLNRKLPGAYALQWQVIRDLKTEGFRRYNLWGIAPPNQPNHRYAGVTTFKTGFGGAKITYVPAHDLVINPVRYAFDYLIEKARKKKRHL